MVRALGRGAVRLPGGGGSRPQVLPIPCSGG
jgi:hypothetical protein